VRAVHRPTVALTILVVTCDLFSMRTYVHRVFNMID
jgi:hypothetical protein